MKSPFPGMDPYLEAFWTNVHAMMVGAVTAALNRSLPEDLQARAEEELRVETLSGERNGLYRGDSAVVETRPNRFAATGTGVGTIAKPIRLPYEHAPILLRDVHIVDRSNSDRVVTVVELLSPWNKLSGDLNKKYIRKLRAFENAGTNWVEIDLLRSSRRRLLIRWEDVPEADRADYLILTYRSDDESVLAYPIALRDALPTVLIPLREVDADVGLNLQEVFESVYIDGRFASVDYSKPPKPPLSPADAAWAAGLIAKSRGASNEGVEI